MTSSLEKKQKEKKEKNNNMFFHNFFLFLAIIFVLFFFLLEDRVSDSEESVRGVKLSFALGVEVVVSTAFSKSDSGIVGAFGVSGVFGVSSFSLSLTKKIE